MAASAALACFIRVFKGLIRPFKGLMRFLRASSKIGIKNDGFKTLFHMVLKPYFRRKAEGLGLKPYDQIASSAREKLASVALASL